MAISFTSGRVENLSCSKGAQQTIHWDAKTPGFGLRVTAAGIKSYIFERRLHGKTVRLTIGNSITWPLSKARAEATRLQMLIDQGVDPRQEAKERAAAAEANRLQDRRRKVSVADAWGVYLNERKQSWSERHLSDHNKLSSLGGTALKNGKGKSKPGALAGLMRLKLSDVTRESINRWLLKEVVVRPTQTALAFRLFQAFLVWCQTKREYQDIADKEACNRKYHKSVLPKLKPKSDALQREQLKSWFESIGAIQNPVISTYLQLLLLTGARAEELANLRWTKVDFKWKRLVVGDKVEEERTIPLTPYAESLLKKLPRVNEWVFSSKSAKSGRLQEARIEHNKKCALVGIDRISLHGLRRSFSTLSEWVECPSGIAAQIMGHKPSATAEKHYKVRPIDLLRLWHQKLEAWILNEAGVKFIASQSEA